MSLKVFGAILSLGFTFLSTGAKTVWWVVATPFGELRLKRISNCELKLSFNMKTIILGTAE